MTNTFWVAANILFDLGTGEKKEVLMLVNHEADATFFKKADVDTYKAFVERRAANIVWAVEPTNLRGRIGEYFVIKGMQND